MEATQAQPQPGAGAGAGAATKRITVFGANGPTGRQVTAQALAAGHTVTAVTRRPEDFRASASLDALEAVPADASRLRVVEADVRDAAAVALAVAGQDAVISALGVPFGRGPVTVYSEGATHITRAMTEHGVRRLVCVTSTVLFGVPAPEEGFFFRRVLEPFIERYVGRTVYDDMRRMEEIVRGSGLDWTIVRPGGLFDAEAVGDHRVSAARQPGRFTSRADLGNVLLRQVSDGADAAVRDYVDVRTTEGTPGFLDVIRKEAFGGRK